MYLPLLGTYTGSTILHLSDGFKTLVLLFKSRINVSQPLQQIRQEIKLV